MSSKSKIICFIAIAGFWSPLFGWRFLVPGTDIVDPPSFTLDSGYWLMMLYSIAVLFALLSLLVSTDQVSSGSKWLWGIGVIALWPIVSVMFAIKLFWPNGSNDVSAI